MRFNNPPIPVDLRRIVFLCLGNICRSAYAHHYFYTINATKKIKVDIIVTSAGLHVKDQGSPEIAISVAQNRGVDLDQHTPIQITEETVKGADMVVAMELGQVEKLCIRYPKYSQKFFLLPFFEERLLYSYNVWHRYHIEDPYGKSHQEFAACFARIERCVNGLILKISSSDLVQKEWIQS